MMILRLQQANDAQSKYGIATSLTFQTESPTLLNVLLRHLMRHVINQPLKGMNTTKLF